LLETRRRLYRPEWEADLMNLDQVYEYLSRGQWFRKVSAVRTISIGGQIYSVGYDWRPDQYIEITLDPQSTQYVCRSSSDEEKRFPTRITKKHLMGKIAPTQLPAFQLALPFSWNEWRTTFYCQLSASLQTGTTF
jgi:hypothetical protein